MVFDRTAGKVTGCEDMRKMRKRRKERDKKKKRVVDRKEEV